MAEKKARPTPEQLTAAYKDGAFTAAEYHDKMRRLASANLGDIIENQGVFKATSPKPSARYSRTGMSLSRLQPSMTRPRAPKRI